MAAPEPSNDGGPGPIALGLSGLSALLFLAYLWFVFAPPPVDLVIAFPHKSVLFAGHIGMVLMKTDLLEQNGVRAEFLAPETLSQFGEDAKKSDVVLTGEAHGLRLQTRNGQARLVATLGSGGRLGFTVPSDSSIQQLSELKGKRVAATPANALHRWTLEATQAAGLADSDWELVPYAGPDDPSAATVDASVLWDPYLYWAESNGRVRTLASSDYFTTVVFDPALVDQDRELGLAVLTAIKQAFYFLNRNPGVVAAWLAGEEGKPPLFVQQACFPVNANFGADGLDGLLLSPLLPSLVRSLEKDNLFLVEQGYLQAPVDLRAVIDGSLMAEVDRLAELPDRISRTSGD